MTEAKDNLSARIEKICHGMSNDEKEHIYEMLLNDPDSLPLLENDDLVSMVVDDDFAPSDKQEQIDFDLLKQAEDLKKLSAIIKNTYTPCVGNSPNTGSTQTSLKKFSFLPSGVFNFQGILNAACIILIGIVIGKSFHQKDVNPVSLIKNSQSIQTQRVSTQSPTIFNPLLKSSAYNNALLVSAPSEDISDFIIPGSLLHKDTINVLGNHYLESTDTIIVSNNSGKDVSYAEHTKPLSDEDKAVSKNLFQGMEAQMTYLFSGGAETGMPSIKIKISRVARKKK